MARRSLQIPEYDPGRNIDGDRQIGARKRAPVDMIDQHDIRQGVIDLNDLKRGSGLKTARAGRETFARLLGTSPLPENLSLIHCVEPGFHRPSRRRLEPLRFAFSADLPPDPRKARPLANQVIAPQPGIDEVFHPLRDSLRSRLRSASAQFQCRCPRIVLSQTAVERPSVALRQTQLPRRISNSRADRLANLFKLQDRTENRCAMLRKTLFSHISPPAKLGQNLSTEPTVW